MSAGHPQAVPAVPAPQGGGPAAAGVPGPVAAVPDAVAARLSALIRDIPDYPQPGVMFKDITPLLADAAGFASAVTALAAGHERIDKVVGIEARGFILAAPVASSLGVGFVPVRKLGKLPGPTHAQTYQLEYGTATVEVHVDSFAPGDRVLIIDDVLATGGTAAATAELVRRCDAEVTALSVLIELGFLGGRATLAEHGIEVRALLGL